MTNRKYVAKREPARISPPRDVRWHTQFPFRTPDVYVDGKLKTNGPTLDELLRKKIPSHAKKQDPAKNHAHKKPSTGLMVSPRKPKLPKPDVYVDGKRRKPDPVS